ncbi:MAG: anhydro-N-acetylmuramic acid kinase [Tenacibaculum sp.]
MSQGFYYVIGIMSGTSLDGIDLVYTKFPKNNFSKVCILHSKTFAYSKPWTKKLQQAFVYSNKKLKKINTEYGVLLANTVKTFINFFDIDRVDIIASHGHTVFHQPNRGITLQIGDGQTIANLTNTTVVSDFRTCDVQLGGQGAPLVPIGDKLLFSNYKYRVNIGGFANISFEKDSKTIAFDLCPANIVLNYYTRKLGFDYDDKGTIASTGIIDKKLLSELNSLSYYFKKPPKSLGIEWVQEHVFCLTKKTEKNIDNLLRTFVEHIAMQISKWIDSTNKTLFTGGGVFNSFLMNRIEFYTRQKIVLSDNQLIKYKEALVFALLAVLRFENKVNCLASVTGASKDHSSGKIFKKISR